uniref:OTU domain-containing protein n=1 Tax=Amphimedon queenslandica TaxID=400682 RepID=A0A1X7UDK0_AMPQE
YITATILPGSPTTPLSNIRVPNSTIDVPGDGNCLLYALSYLITGSILSITNYITQLLIIC